MTESTSSSETTPIIYILHGEDEFGIAQKLAEFEAGLGDPTNASLNTTWMDSTTFQPDQLLATAAAMPFLARRRLVILTNVLAKMSDKNSREKFLAQLNQIPPTTALILVEHGLSKGRGDSKKEFEWVENFAKSSKRVWIKDFPLPKGTEWVKRIQELAKKEGGQITTGAAELLDALLDGDLRLAAQEVFKLLAYVNYHRPITEDDVQELTADVGQGDIFKLVDALGNRDGRKALSMLRRLMEYQDYYTIIGMMARQVRLLLQTREIIDRGGGNQEVLSELKLYRTRFLVDRLIGQARRFTFSHLKHIQQTLLEMDEAVKTSQMGTELAVEVFTIELSTKEFTSSR